MSTRFVAERFIYFVEFVYYIRLYRLNRRVVCVDNGRCKISLGFGNSNVFPKRLGQSHFSLMFSPETCVRPS